MSSNLNNDPEQIATKPAGQKIVELVNRHDQLTVELRNALKEENRAGDAYNKAMSESNRIKTEIENAKAELAKEINSL